MTALPNPTDTAPGTGAQAPAGRRSMQIRGRRYPVVLPRLRDPFLHFAALNILLQVLGQTVLGFELSIAQILVSVGTSALIEFTIKFVRLRSIIWPTTAMLTGNSVALILRVPGTTHGDWFSLNGWYYFAGVAAVSILSKHLIRYKGKQIFNPSNLGLVIGFLVLGSSRIEPLDLWWGPISPGLVAALVVVTGVALLVDRRLGLFTMAIAFLVTFAIGTGILAASGHCMTARWRFGAICDGSYWWVLVTSPEIFIFAFFMLTDPRPIPRGRVARAVFGVAVAVQAVFLMAPQQTEFATKVAILSSLVVICAARLYFEKFFPAVGSEDDKLRVWLSRLAGRKSLTSPRPAIGALASRVALALGLIAVLSVALVVIGVPGRQPIDTFRPADAMVARPDISVDAGSVPQVTIDPGVRRIDADITQEKANSMAHDAAADLQIEAEALKKADRDLAMTADGGARLNWTWKQIDDARSTGHVTLCKYKFDSAKLVLVYDTVNAQAGPQYGLEVRGTETRTTYDGATASNVVREEQVPYERTYALLHRKGNYLIAADYPIGGA